jgi:PQQ-like domain
VRRGGVRRGDVTAERYDIDAAFTSVDEVSVATDQRHRAGRRMVLGIAGLALALAAMVAVRTVFDAEPTRPEVSLTSGDPRRVPVQPNELWSVPIRGAGGAKSTEIFVHERDLVAAVVDDGSRARAAIVGLNASDGSQRWRRSFSFAPDEYRLIGVLDGVLIVQQSDVSQRRQLFALDLVDGETRWELDANVTGPARVLVGSTVITRFAAGDPGDAGNDAQIEFIDPRSGAYIGSVEGSIASTDLNGGWYFWSRGELMFVDLAAPTDAIEAQTVRSAGVTDSPGDAIVIDNRVLNLGPSGMLQELLDDGSAAEVRIIGADLGDVAAADLVPVGGGRFVIDTGTGLVGADLGRSAVDVRWKHDGELLSVTPTERGVVMVVRNTALEADRLDDEFFIVDAVSGVDIGRINVPRGEPIEPIVAGDGFVVRRTSVNEDELDAFDLDGEPLWTLVVAGRVQLGDRLVVALDTSGSSYVVTAYGDPI